MLDPEQVARAVQAAARAPSPHNIQPARWRFPPDGCVELHENVSRWLRVGDPTGRDNALALGAAWEGMAIALSEIGMRLEAEDVEELNWPFPGPGEHRLVARARLHMGGVPDALAGSVSARRSFRGVFPSASEAESAALARLCATQAVRVLTGAATMKSVAAWYDAAAAAGMREPEFVRELYGWMRFSPRDPASARDGLSTDCMALSPFEAGAARIALKPGVVRLLCTLGLEGMLVSEAAKVRSAAAVALLHAPVLASWFDAGRQFYRFWLELAHARLCGVPMSALADSPEHSALLLSQFPLPAGHRLVGVLRVGPRPVQGIPCSARLPTAELLLP